MDILSEVLRVVRLSGAVHFCAEFTHHWAILTPPADMVASHLCPGAEAVTPFHIATAGKCWLSWGDVAPIPFEAGDVVVFARAAQHVLASGPGLAPVPIKDIYRPSAERIAVLRHGGGGEKSCFICGFLHSDRRFVRFWSVRCRRSRAFASATVPCCLNPIRIRADTQKPIVLQDQLQWWQAATNHLVREATKPGPGNGAVLARLSELLFMEVLRWQLTCISDGHNGWFAGLNDAHVGRALAFLHADPAGAWTVEELAQKSGISRAALAKRFVELVGASPMQYLAGWRMHLARRLLRETNISVAELAARVGYKSEAAFSRAFRRSVGVPPATWRDVNASAPEH